VVYPAAAFPAMAKENGAKLVIINREPTPLDGIADHVIRAEIGLVLSAFIPRNRKVFRLPKKTSWPYGRF
jgi:NAD-dependent deacetylase